MRKLLSLCVMALFLMVGIALAFQWEGELDPNEFDKWKVISAKPGPQGIIWAIAKNPDQASPIDIVAMAVTPNSILVGYRYFKYGEPYQYVFNAKQDKYIQRPFTDEQKKGCMKCHSDKLIAARI